MVTTTPQIINVRPIANIYANRRADVALAILGISDGVDAGTVAHRAIILVNFIQLQIVSLGYSVLCWLPEQIKETDVAEECRIALVANVVTQRDRVEHLAQSPSIVLGPV